MSIDRLPLYSPSLEEVINRAPIVVNPNLPLLELLSQMNPILGSSCSLGKDSEPTRLHHASSYALVQEGDRLAGILTERDMVKLSAERENLAQKTVGDVMTRSLVTLNARDYQDIFSVLSLLRQNSIRHLPIVDDRARLIGAITLQTLQNVLQPTNWLRLRATIAEVMQREILFTAPTTSALDVVRLMANYRKSCVVIAEARSRLMPLGIITERDIIKFQIFELDLSRLQAADVMSSTLFSLSPGETLLTAHQMMLQKRVRRLTIVGNGGELLGLVTQTSLLRPLNPIELYNAVEVLQEKVNRLEAEKLDLLQQRNAELERQVQERTTKLQQQARCDRLLAEIAQNVRQSLNLNEILSTTVCEVQQFLGCDRVAIYQFQRDWSCVVVAESAIEGYQPFLGKTVSDSCFAPNWIEPYTNGRIRAVDDIYTADMSPCHVQFLEKLQIRAKLLVPIILHDTGRQNTRRLWGLIAASQCQAPRQWQPFEIELLQKLAVQMGIALQQSELYRKSQMELKDRQQAEAALRDSEKRYSTLVEISPVGIFHTDRYGNCLYVNERWCEMAGLYGKEVLGMGWIRAIHPRDRGRVAGKWYAALEQRVPFQLEYRFQRPDGVTTWIFGQAVAELGDDGEVTGYVGTIADINAQKAVLRDRQAAEEALRKLNDELEHRVERRTTELKQANKKLQHEIVERKQVEEELWQQSLKSQLFAVIALKIRQSLELKDILQTTVTEIQKILQVDRVLIYRVFFDGTGCVVTEAVLPQWPKLLNMHFLEDVFPLEAQRQYTPGRVKAVGNIEETYRHKARCLLDVARQWCIKAKLIVPIWQDEQLWGFIIAHQCSRDRDWKEFEIELLRQLADQVGIALYQAQLLEQEKDLNELKSRFVSMTSHEFRTPLSVISSSAGLIQDYGDRVSTEKRQKHLNRIQSSVKHMTQLLEDVLAINRAESDRLEFRPTAIDIVEFCRDLVEELQQSSPQHAIIFQTHEIEIAHKDAQFCYTYIDEKLLRQILTNLLSNAIKYSPQGGTIDLNYTHNNRQLTFEVRDRGIGIPIEDQERLFESFYRAENVGAIPGTGLGLTIVKKCVDLHQGEISVKSEPGKGTTFIVILPQTDLPHSI
ncbi:GAF domain-containing protein [Lusitaniella coriacea]|uniref:GAF domain-containing protein n=1 Tax=Lusitaniella coriacea TaxID=1983105 RepID=UPI003CE9B31D